MTKAIVLAATFLITAASQAIAAMPADEFVKKAAMAGMFEVQSSQLAVDRLDDAAVRDFAHEMVNDHGEANQKLKEIAQKEGIEVPSEMDQAHQQKMEKLRNAGDDFRSTYVSMQVDAHKQAVQLFETYAAEGENGALKGFAEETLPILKDHREDITALQKGAQKTN